MLPAVPAVPAIPAVPKSAGAPAVPARPADAPLPVTVPPAADPAADAPVLPVTPELPAAPELPTLPELPATPDTSALLGTVGDLADTVTGLLSSLTSAVDLGVVQQLVSSLQAVLQGLLGQLPTPPVTVPAPPTIPGSGTQTRSDQLASLKAQAQSLADTVAAARAAALHPHPTAG
ncbi:hypothetical protein ACFQ0M_21740 [Kitasatospora aburaviensis]